MTGQRLLVLLFVLMLPLVTPKVRGADEIEYFSYLRSLTFDRDLHFDNEFRYFYDRDPQGLAAFKETFIDRLERVTRRPINFASVGCAILWSPVYLLTHGMVLIARVLGAGVEADGFSRPYLAAVGYTSAAYAFLGLLLTHDALKRWGGVPDGPATAVVAAVWWGSPLLYYMTLAPAFSHATSMLTVGVLLWLSLRTAARDAWTPVEAALLGLVGGLAALVREQDLLYLAIPALLLAGAVVRTRRWAAGALFLGVMGVVANLTFLPQRLAYHALNGTYGPSELVRRKMTLTSPHFFEVLVDPGHGLFIWTPLLALAVAGLVVLVVRRRDVLAVALLAAFLLQIWICGSVESWHQAGAFGSRRFVSATPVLAFGLAALAGPAWQRAGRGAVAAVLALFVWWNVSLMIQFGLKLMNRQRLEWPRVARNQVVEVPRRLGRVALLFFTDRERLVQETR